MNDIPLPSANGTGRYDEEAEKVYNLVKREDHPTGVLLLVINGSKGHGFSAVLTQDMNQRMPEILRHVAEMILEMQNKAKGN